MTKTALLQAKLVLEDGSVYMGTSIGVPGTVFGELVFNTSATGYQEVLTDPSYKGQVVLMTSPEIGNYGVNPEDYESEVIQVSGFVVRHLSPVTSSWRAQISLQDFLARHNVVGIQGVDTRAITRILRNRGVMACGITTENIEAKDFLKQVQSQLAMDDVDFVSQVTTKEPYTMRQEGPLLPGPTLDRLVVVDFGIKQSILRSLQAFVREIIVVPANSSFETIKSYQPQGVLLSNGPGDPRTLPNAVAMVQTLVESGIPTFGICLGHQILAMACGAKVEKMQFGHHGGNHPVMDLETRQVKITSQNHNYAAVFTDFPEDKLRVTHINLNDQSIEGFAHIHAPVSSVQFHPEANPGPLDMQYLFEKFIRQAALAHAA